MNIISLTTLIAKVSLVGRALAWGLDPRAQDGGCFCTVDVNLYDHILGTVIAQRFGIANMKFESQEKTRSKPAT